MSPSILEGAIHLPFGLSEAEGSSSSLGECFDFAQPERVGFVRHERSGFVRRGRLARVQHEP